VLAAIDQTEVMQALMGSDPESYVTPQGFLSTGKPEVDRAGIEASTRRRTPAELKQMFAEAGYKGERVVLLHTSDQPFYHAATLVVADSLARAGLNVDDQAMDWGTVLQRRAKKDPLDKGGWSLFVSVTPVPEYINPLLGSLLRGNGKDAWIGWPEIPRIEAAYGAWLDAADPAEQTRLEREIQLTAYEEVPFIPMGRYMPRIAWSKTLTAPLKGPAPTFWDIRRV
jgi:peptide/nickel transport system substrate-binding protein